MKKLLILLTVLILLVPLVGFAQTAELTADTPATVDWLGEILKALLIAFVSLMGFLVKNVIPLINQWLKAVMHFRGSSVVADALTVAMAEMSEEIQKVAADGVITSDEKEALKKRAKEIAEGKLRNLSGFYKKDLIGWLDEVLEVELGKLLSRIFGSKSSSSAVR